MVGCPLLLQLLLSSRILEAAIQNAVRASQGQPHPLLSGCGVCRAKAGSRDVLLLSNNLSSTMEMLLRLFKHRFSLLLSLHCQLVAYFLLSHIDTGEAKPRDDLFTMNLLF